MEVSKQSDSGSSEHLGMILNWDILIAVLPFTLVFSAEDSALEYPDRKYLSHFMRTCRTLFDAGLPVLFQHNIEVPRNRRKATSFLRSFIRDKRRAEYVQRFSVGRMELWELEMNSALDLPSERTFPARDIAIVIRLLRNLTHLVILAVEDLLEAFPGAFDAIQSLTNLTTIRFERMGARSDELVSSIDSPIVDAYLDWSHETDRYIIPPDPVPLVAPYHNTLTVLVLTYPPMLVPHGTIRFPQLRTLHLVHYEAGLSLDALMYAFPSVREFRWLHSDDEVRVVDLEAEEELRVVNSTGVIAAHLPVHRSWTELDELACITRQAYALGMRCKVRFWRAFSLFSHRVAQLHIVLRDIRPTFLRLYVHVGSFHKAHMSLAEIFPDDLPDLTHLDISLCWTKNDDKVNVDDVFEDLTRCLASIPSLTLVTIAFVYDREDSSTDAYLQTAFIPEYISNLAHDVPNLNFASIAFSFKQWPRSFWRFNQGVGVEQLTSSAGREVIRTTTPFDDGAYV